MEQWQGDERASQLYGGDPQRSRQHDQRNWCEYWSDSQRTCFAVGEGTTVHQAVLCGGLTELINAGFQTLVEAGYQPEIAYFETCHEVKLIVDIIYQKGFEGMWKDVSNTAEYGGLTRRNTVIGEEAKKGMKEVLKQIQDGTFKDEFADEYKTGFANLKEMRSAENNEQIEKVGTRLRKACGLQKDDE